MQNLKKLEDAEIFMLLHGERIIDTLGEEVDRIEKSLKVGMYFLHLYEMKELSETKIIFILS